MYLLYLDDSGSESNKDEPYIVLGGLAIYEAQANYLTQRLNELALSINPSDPDSVEFHASAIYNGKEEPWKSMEKAKRREVIKQVLKIFADCYENTKAFACALKKADFPDINPMEELFEDLCSRFNIFLSELGNEQQTRQRGLIILDESSHETTLIKLAKNFRKFGTKWGTIRELADNPLFADSTSSRLIQLADHIAYAVFRRYGASDANYFDVIAHRFHAKNGIIHGLSHKSKSDYNCMCPACLTRRNTT